MNKLGCLLASAMLVCAVHGAPETRPAEPPPAPKPAKPAEPLPDLDSLLGTKPEKKPDPAKPAPDKPGSTDTTRKELDRQLSLKEQADEFAKAVALMDETADRVEKEKDIGLDTQRLQEDILTRLDRLIKAAKNNQSKQQQQQQQSDGKDQKNENMRQQSQAQKASQKAGENADGPARQEGQLGSPPPAAPAAWGDLPAHVRDSLMQGFSDRFSSMYQTLTETYYRKLAEEKKK